MVFCGVHAFKFLLGERKKNSKKSYYTIMLMHKFVYNSCIDSLLLHSTSFLWMLMNILEFNYLINNFCLTINASDDWIKSSKVISVIIFLAESNAEHDN